MEGTVIEKSTGLMESKTADEAPSSQDGAASYDKANPPAKTYTQKEMDALIQMAQRRAGDQVATVTRERDALKIKMADYDATISDKQSELEDLQAQVDELASGSPEYAEILAERKKAKEELKKLKDDRGKLDAEKLEHAETIKMVQSELRSQQIFETIMKFEVPEKTWDSMYDLCDRFGASNIEDFEALAGTIGGKVPEKRDDDKGTDKGTALHVDSGSTSGGRFDTSKMSPDEKIEAGLKLKIKQVNRR